ncbi:MAG: SPASM domain-containing protein [Lachnospiraceae bacterium]|nr:SPASM domain-containing protein [Lachnospiraceae bacterium]
MVHLYENNGFKIALDVNSGAIHLVDEAAYNLIPEIEELVNAKMLFTPDNYEDYANEINDRETVVKALCLHVAHDCNLACRYCFAEEGDYGAKCPNAPKLMSLKTGKRALDFLIANSGNRVNLEVDFFGGEPLLNWEVIKELVAYGRSLEEKAAKKFRFTLTTNGILLTEAMFEFINREISNVVLSIDGRPFVNDRMRPLHDGRGSYDLVVGKFLKLAESRKQANYFVRGTFTRLNLDFAEDVKHLASLGFKQISIEPVVTAGAGAGAGVLAGALTESVNETDEKSFAIRKEDIPAICAEYDRLAAYLIEQKSKGKPINFFHFMIDLTGGPCVAKRLSGCGAGSEYLAVTPAGDFYPCHQFVGQPDFLMGNLNDGITATAIYDNFKAINVYTKPKCRSCFAKFYCSGGCAASAYKICKSLTDCDDLACELQRKRVECAIMIKASETGNAAQGPK